MIGKTKKLETKADWRSAFRKKQVGVDDMTLLSSVTNEHIMQNLEQRFHAGEIYTYIGHVLISVNPFRDLGLYTTDILDSYTNKARIEMPPHVFAIAEEAYRNLCGYGENQSVIISGESGAGKTEVAKLILRYLTTVSGASSSNVDRIKNRVLASNPLLESFGNAKTLRNDNSSRFGKYLEIVFDENNEPIGALTTNYLLEKARVVHQSKLERNFHVFYQLLAGANEQEKQAYCLYSAEDYLYLSECTTVPGVDDAAHFQETRDAMTIIGISEDEQQRIFALLAGILWLGNMAFGEVDDRAQIASQEVVEMVAYLFEVDSVGLTYALTHRYIETGGSVGRRGSGYDVPLNAVQAKAARDALAKAIYDHLFNYVVKKTNESLSISDGKRKSIGILDIYGFEVFDKNYFEQLCINYVNEKLQQIFVELTLKAEQEEYVRENIKWTPIAYFNNKIVCDLIEGKRPPGIFSIMNDVNATAHAESDAADRSLVQRLASCSSHKHFHQRGNSFCVKHYAGDVVYEAIGMPEKNKDVLNLDLRNMIRTSKNEFLVQIFPTEFLNDDQKKPSCADRIRSSANVLVEALSRTRPSYVRCIKPNEMKSAELFDKQRVMHQVKYLGLLENVRVRRAGFCFRQEYEKFMSHFFLLSKRTCYAGQLTFKWNTVQELKEGCRYIVEDALIDRSEWQLGKTKIFIRHPETLWALEHLRDMYWHHMATRIQRMYRNYVRRKNEAAATIQKTYRQWNQVKEFKQLRDKGHSIYEQQKERRRFSLLSCRRFLGDYLNVKENDEIKSLLSIRHALFSMSGFVLEEKKLLGKAKMLQRDIILTKTQLILLGRDKKKPDVLKIDRRVAVSSLIAVVTSPCCDDWVVIFTEGTEEGDLVLNCPFKTELLTRISEMKKISTCISSEVTYAKHKKKHTLKFQSDPTKNREETHLKGNTILVGRGENPESMPRVLAFKKPSKFVAKKQTPFPQSKSMAEVARLPPKSGTVAFYKALYAYTAQRDDELTFEVGDTFEMVEEDDQWMKAKVISGKLISVGAVGWIPLNYLEKMALSTPPMLPPNRPAPVAPKSMNNSTPALSNTPKFNIPRQPSIAAPKINAPAPMINAPNPMLKPVAQKPATSKTFVPPTPAPALNKLPPAPLMKSQQPSLPPKPAPPQLPPFKPVSQGYPVPSNDKPKFKPIAKPPSPTATKPQARVSGSVRDRIAMFADKPPMGFGSSPAITPPKTPE